MRVGHPVGFCYLFSASALAPKNPPSEEYLADRSFGRGNSQFTSLSKVGVLAMWHMAFGPQSHGSPTSYTLGEVTPLGLPLSLIFNPSGPFLLSLLPVTPPQEGQLVSSHCLQLTRWSSFFPHACPVSIQ